MISLTLLLVWPEECGISIDVSCTLLKGCGNIYLNMYLNGVLSVVNWDEKWGKEMGKRNEERSG